MLEQCLITAALPSIVGSCPKNTTCKCEMVEEESRKLVLDRNNVLFQRAFEDKIFMSVFSKPSDEDDDKKSTKTGTKKVAKDPDVASASTLCSQNSSSVSRQHLLSSNTCCLHVC